MRNSIAFACHFISFQTMVEFTTAAINCIKRAGFDLFIENYNLKQILLIGFSISLQTIGVFGDLYSSLQHLDDIPEFISALSHFLIDILSLIKMWCFLLRKRRIIEVFNRIKDMAFEGLVVSFFPPKYTRTYYFQMKNC